MHIELAKEIVKTCRQREREGDHPTVEVPDRVAGKLRHRACRPTRHRSAGAARFHRVN
jgi:hypothetical protein